MITRRRVALLGLGTLVAALTPEAKAQTPAAPPAEAEPEPHPDAQPERQPEQVPDQPEHPQPEHPQAPAETPPQEPPPRQVEQRPLNLLFIGDSLAQGLVLHMMGTVRRMAAVRVDNETQHATGFTRYHEFNWQRKVDEVLQRQHYGAAVMWMGLNDFRPLVDLETRARYDFGTPNFNQIYTARVDALIDRVKRDSLPLFWLGLPLIRNEQNDRAMRRANEMQRLRVVAKGETWIDTVPLTSPDRVYTPFLSDPTRGQRRIRAEDGSHFTDIGYQLIAEELLRAIVARVPAFTDAVAPAPPRR